jgi:hypothetical protein
MMTAARKGGLSLTNQDSPQTGGGGMCEVLLTDLFCAFPYHISLINALVHLLKIGSGESTTPAVVSRWNSSSEKCTVLFRVLLLLSVVAFLEGYLTTSAHYMVNHMDTTFRLNQGSSEIDYTKNRNKVLRRGQKDTASSTVLSTSIVTNFHYIYASDTYAQTEGSTASATTHPVEHERLNDRLFQTHGFSWFARGWIVCLLIGQAVGCGLAWKLTDTLGR